MPHITFIHGIANKPEKEELLAEWEGALTDGGLDLAAEGVTTSMVYWADVMYEQPSPTSSGHEAVSEGLGTGALDEDLDWMKNLPDEEREMVESLRAKMGFDRESPSGDEFSPEAPQGEIPEITFEAIPLPWFVKRRVMKILLRDVHHYLFDAVSTPRPGESYQVQSHIRKLFVDQLIADAGANDDGNHIVVSHSMGTVISYDCLKNVPECPAVDGYMTVGSPLGISEVHDNFKPTYRKVSAFPSSKLSGGWVNVFDRLDPVSLDARISNDYQNAGAEVVKDLQVWNDGAWRHSSWKYFGQETLCEELRTLLDL